MADAAEIPEKTYIKYEAGERIPGGEALAALAKAGINLAELLIGKVDMPGQRVEEPRAGYSFLPLYEVRAGAAARGHVVGSEQPVSELAFRDDWIRANLHTGPENLSLIHVEGDSMEPDLRAGDIILVDHTDTAARREGIYVVRMEDALLVKQVQRLPGGVLKLTSRNAAYQPISLPLAESGDGHQYSIIGRVVWACRRI